MGVLRCCGASHLAFVDNTMLHITLTRPEEDDSAEVDGNGNLEHLERIKHRVEARNK